MIHINKQKRGGKKANKANTPCTQQVITSASTQGSQRLEGRDLLSSDSDTTQIKHPPQRRPEPACSLSHPHTSEPPKLHETLSQRYCKATSQLLQTWGTWGTLGRHLCQCGGGGRAGSSSWVPWTLLPRKSCHRVGRGWKAWLRVCLLDVHFRVDVCLFCVRSTQQLYPHPVTTPYVISVKLTKAVICKNQSIEISSSPEEAISLDLFLHYSWIRKNKLMHHSSPGTCLSTHPTSQHTETSPIQQTPLLRWEPTQIMPFQNYKWS